MRASCPCSKQPPPEEAEVTRATQVRGGLRGSLAVRRRLRNPNCVPFVETQDLAWPKADCCVRVGDFFSIKLNATRLDQAADLRSRFIDSENVLERVANETYEIRIVIGT